MSDTIGKASEPHVVDPTEPSSGKGSRKGCLFWTLVVIGVLVALLAAAGYLTLRTIENRVEDISSDKPLEMPTPHQSAERRLALIEQVEAFLHNIKAGNSDRLVLTGDDINILLSHYTPMKEKGWLVHVSIEGETIRVKASIPVASLVDMTPFPLERVGKRYLNGSFDFSVSKKDGRLEVHLKDLDLGDREVPGDVRAELQRENRADDVMDSPVGDWVGALHTIEVRDGTLILER